MTRDVDKRFEAVLAELVRLRQRHREAVERAEAAERELAAIRLGIPSLQPSPRSAHRRLHNRKRY